MHLASTEFLTPNTSLLKGHQEDVGTETCAQTPTPQEPATSHMGTRVTPPLDSRKVWPVPHIHTGSSGQSGPLLEVHRQPAYLYHPLLTSWATSPRATGSQTSQCRGGQKQASGHPETDQLAVHPRLTVVGTQPSLVTAQLGLGLPPTEGGKQGGGRWG